MDSVKAFFDTTTIVPCITTGTTDDVFHKHNVLIYPNPVKDLLTLKIVNIKTKDLKIKMLDINGRKIFNHNLINYSGNYVKELDTSKLSKGLYTIQVIIGDEKITRKVIIF